MGVPQFLSKALQPQSAGRDFDLREHVVAVGGRPLRVAVDVSAWIYKACQGFGHMLGDERHLDNYGRACLLQEQQEAEREEREEDSEGGRPSRKRQRRTTISDEELHKFVTACTDYVWKRLKRLRSIGLQLIVVLDGASPPIKAATVQARRVQRDAAIRQRDAPVVVGEEDLEARLQAFGRAGAGRDHYVAVVNALLVVLRTQELPFLVAPYEADGQLAYLSQQRLVDLVITEDSDLVACGASPLLYKLLDKKKPKKKKAPDPPTRDHNGSATTAAAAENASPQAETGGEVDDEEAALFCGKLLRREDLGATRGNSVNWMDFTLPLLCVVFAAAGCDYCQSLRGIGIGTATGIVRQAYFGDRRDSPPLRRVFDLLYQKARHVPTDKVQFEADFLAALVMFRHPVVFDPVRGKCVIANYYHEGSSRRGGGDAEFLSFPPYRRLWEDAERVQAIVGRLVPMTAPLGKSISSTSTRAGCCWVAEGWLRLQPGSGGLLQPRDPNVTLPDYVQQYLDEQQQQSSGLDSATSSVHGAAAATGAAGGGATCSTSRGSSDVGVDDKDDSQQQLESQPQFNEQPQPTSEADSSAWAQQHQHQPESQVSLTPPLETQPPPPDSGTTPGSWTPATSPHHQQRQRQADQTSSSSLAADTTASQDRDNERHNRNNNEDSVSSPPLLETQEPQAGA